MGIITPHDVVACITGNAWSMDLSTFARHLGADQADENVRDRYLAFQEAARQLGRLDHKTIAVITRRPEGR